MLGSADFLSNAGSGAVKYEDLVNHMKGCVRLLLKKFQCASQSVNEYMELCAKYEAYQFHKLQEVEHFYLLKKKHYLAKTFSKEFAVKLENNMFVKQSFVRPLGPTLSSDSTSSGGS